MVDEIGVDPLRDKSYDAIMSIGTYSPHTVKVEEEFNMPLLSYNVYLNEEYWRVLMVFNGLLDMFELKAGMRIRIPPLALVTAALNNVLLEESSRPSVVRI